MYKISIIIPIFNASKYLKSTIKSVLNQTIGFKNIELILVDDNSIDNSKEIIKKYSCKYQNIISYFSNEKHGTPSFGRNWGIDNSNSDYIMFLDNDDLLDEKICEKLYNIIIKENADICACNRILSDNTGSVKYPMINTNNDYLILTDEALITFPSTIIHGKLFKKELLLKNNIKFQKTTAEDFLFCTQCFLHSKKLVSLNNYYGYTWIINKESLSHSDHDYNSGYIDTSYRVLNLLKKEKKEKFIPIIFKWTPRNVIRTSMELDWDKEELKNNLIQLHNFEKDVDFSINKNEPWINFINHFIIYEHYKIAIFFIKLLHTIKNNKLLLIIIRKLLGND